MIAGIIGSLGFGKTATLAALAINFYSQGFKIYTNFDLRINGKAISTRVSSYEDFERVKDGYLFLDEFWQYADSRRSGSKDNSFVSGLLLKSRKRGYNLFYSAQSYGSVDKRLRMITDYLLVPDKRIIMNGKRIKIQQDLLHPISMKQYFSFTWIDVHTLDAYTGQEIGDVFTFKLDAVALLYNTNEEVLKLNSTEVEKGIQKENLFKNELEYLYPKKTLLVPDSGRNQNSFDVELRRGNDLIIFDVCSLDKKTDANEIVRYYMDLRSKNRKRFEDVEASRGCETYFAYKYDEKYYVAPALKVWDLKKPDSGTVALTKFLSISKNLNEFGGKV